MTTPFDPSAFLSTCSGRPGVYRMFDSEARLLYVGKAKNLKNRLASYFRKSGLAPKTAALVARIAQVETTITATEALDPISPQYLGDLIAWTAIGARTTESQTHREMSSGLSTPVGFKNGTDGDISIAVNAILSSAHPHSFLGINGEGNVAIVRTRGNAYGHVVLRGGDGRPNYDSVSIAIAEQALAKAKLPANLVVDCSHANSYKKPELQPLVMGDVINQIRQGNRSLVGVMIESNLVGGNQKIPQDLSQLTYGCSVTDGCIDWDTTATMLRDAHAHLLNRPA